MITKQNMKFLEELDSGVIRLCVQKNILDDGEKRQFISKFQPDRLISKGMD